MGWEKGVRERCSFSSPVARLPLGKTDKKKGVTTTRKARTRKKRKSPRKKKLKKKLKNVPKRGGR